uniref:Uncharacterized protein n=1 Tax=viral metagenome TaxID=1070528 RepID=A0A6H2A4K2_9ZZZZ
MAIYRERLDDLRVIARREFSRWTDKETINRAFDEAYSYSGMSGGITGLLNVRYILMDKYGIEGIPLKSYRIDRVPMEED